MAKTEYVDLTSALDPLYFKYLVAQDRFIAPHITKKFLFYSRKRKAGLNAKTLLPQIAAAWNALTDEEKVAWGNAGAEMNLNGYRLFVQDKSARIINDFVGNAVPSLFHQSWVGNLKIEAPATELKIVQYHPHFYWVSKSVAGYKGKREPVLITEDPALPIYISLNYSSNLVSTGEGSFAKYYARVWSSLQGVDIFTNLEIDLDFVSDWKNASAVLSVVPGHLIAYDLYFHLYNLRGDLYFDNIKAEHSGQNWVRDSFCKDILQGFTRAFFQVPAHWSALILPAGSYFDSIYKDF